ncbi:hypothetical protein, partial [Anaerocolumna sp.]|uniref:hypothetical protein n=1 Tax=Anaerocolumna sp. TaxID=2041569 RepID=UPI0028AFEA6C
MNYTFFNENEDRKDQVEAAQNEERRGGPSGPGFSPGGPSGPGSSPGRPGGPGPSPGRPGGP